MEEFSIVKIDPNWIVVMTENIIVSHAMIFAPVSREKQQQQLRKIIFPILKLMFQEISL